ncbi:MAG: hypothetical protein HY815_13145 [Candidatus Riflebacteria bacterium]|nr:hypothetical protein [Candidatus Riflebacteria bacterium]
MLVTASLGTRLTVVVGLFLRAGVPFVVLAALAAAPADAAQPGEAPAMSLLDVSSDTPANGAAPAAQSPQPAWSIMMEMYGGYGAIKRRVVTVSACATGALARVDTTLYRKADPIVEERSLAIDEASALWSSVEASDALRLKDNLKLRGRVTDMYTYKVTVTRGGGSNSFTVYGPELLGTKVANRGLWEQIRALFPNDDKKYLAVVRAIREVFPS